MLSDTDKENIKLQEQYRIEVRKQLGEKTPNKSRVWTFLNSTFGLWLLSAFLITWAGTLYTQSQNKRAEAQKKQEIERNESLKSKELLERLDLEIGYRFSQTQIQLASTVNWIHHERPFLFKPGNGEKDVKMIIDGLTQPPKGRFPPLYEEFSGLSTLALIAELRRHIPPEEQQQLDHIMADLSGIYVHLDVNNVSLANVDKVAKTIFDDLTLPRWRKGDFYFSDCPFC